MKKALISFFIILCLAVVTIFFVPAVKVLSISNRKNQNERFYSRQAFKNGFEISYTHSVNKGRVHDIYSVKNDDTLEVNDSVFVSYGAGIPEPEETPGAEFILLENGYEIHNLHRCVPKLVMAVGIIANHSITIPPVSVTQAGNSEEYFLTDFFAPQTSLYLDIKRVSIFEYVTHILKK